VTQKARFHCEDIGDFCERNQASFDIATTFDFSEHIDDETFLKVYGAIRKSLAANGRLYLHTPNLDFIIERAKSSGVLKQFPEHIGVRTGLEQKALLSQCGFGEITIKTIPHYNILKWVHPLSYLPVVGPLFSARLWIEARAAK